MWRCRERASRLLLGVVPTAVAQGGGSSFNHGAQPVVALLGLFLMPLENLMRLNASKNDGCSSASNGAGNPMANKTIHQKVIISLLVLGIFSQKLVR